MQYDPIKSTLGRFFNKAPFLRILFYKMLDLLLLRTWHIRRELKRWENIRKPELNVLDAGSGFGQYTYFLSSLNPKWNIFGVDVKHEQIADCNGFFKKIGKENRVQFEYADLTAFEHKNKYDLILSVDVMEHILEDEKVFVNFFASIQPNGMLLISTPSDQGGSDVHDDHEHSFIDEHVRDGYNMQDIKDKLTRAGFSKIEAMYSYGTPGKISWKLSMKFPIKMLNVSKIFFIFIPVYYLVFFPMCLILNYFDTVGTHKTGTGLIVKAWK